MTNMVQIAVAGTVDEAEELRTLLASAGIDSALEPAVEHHPSATDDTPTKVLVPETDVEAAQDAIEALTEPDELLGD